MKTTYTFISMIVFCLSLNAQTSKKSTYLVVRIPYTYQSSSDSQFCSIDVEAGNPYAKEVYSLINFNIGKATVNQKASFFHLRSDTTTVYYNYFRNRTEALLFLSEHSWELISVSNDIKSIPQTRTVATDNIGFTIIEAYPVFYFKKLIE